MSFNSNSQNIKPKTFDTNLKKNIKFHLDSLLELFHEKSNLSVRMEDNFRIMNQEKTQLKKSEIKELSVYISKYKEFFDVHDAIILFHYLIVKDCGVDSDSLYDIFSDIDITILDKLRRNFDEAEKIQVTDELISVIRKEKKNSPEFLSYILTLFQKKQDEDEAKDVTDFITYTDLNEIYDYMCKTLKELKVCEAQKNNEFFNSTSQTSQSLNAKASNDETQAEVQETKSEEFSYSKYAYHDIWSSNKKANTARKTCPTAEDSSSRCTII